MMTTAEVRGLGANRIRILPANHDAEATVLGGFLTHPEALADVIAEARADWFENDGHKVVFLTIGAMTGRGEQVTPTTVKEELRRVGALERVHALLLEALAAEFTTVDMVRSDARVLADLAFERRAKAKANRVLRAQGAAAVRAALAELDELPSGGQGFEPARIDWAALAEGPAEVRYVAEPYIPAGGRVWAWGPAESGKSIWTLAEATALSRRKVRTTYFSEENPLPEDLRRLNALSPDLDYLSVFNGTGLDLAEPEHVRGVIALAEGAALVVFDTLTACWSGDENDNAAIVKLDREALVPIVRATGASVLVVHHTGHPQPFVNRRGVGGGRGASAMGQKTDVVLEFAPRGATGFTITHSKARIGGRKEPARAYEVVDLPEGGFAVMRAEEPKSEGVHALADRMVEAIEAAGEPLSKNQLRDRVRGGRVNQDAAMSLLRQEQPPRVRVRTGPLPTEGGRQDAEAWEPA
jgi:hypothetical protein